MHFGRKIQAIMLTYTKKQKNLQKTIEKNKKYDILEKFAN